MAHTLKKFISCRGSALFMVVSTMTALTICCMAMYFSVVSSRSTQYAIFNQRQAYESASSIAEAVLAGVNTNHPSFAGLYNEMSAMEVGDVISTGANGFEAFGAATGIESTDKYDSQMGAYMVEITRLPDNETNNKKVFDMAYTVSVNGVKDVYHAIVEVSTTPKETPPAPTQIFAATGYVPNDAFLDGGFFYTDVFFDTENTVANAYGQKACELYGNFSTGGSLTINKYLHMTSEEPATLAIRGNFTSTKTCNNPLEFNKRSTVMIGGNYISDNTSGGFTFKNADVYILGDYIATGTSGPNDSTWFVNGDVYMRSEVFSGSTLNNFYVNGNIYIIDNGSSPANLKIIETKTPSKRWDDSIGSDYMNKTEFIAELNERTETNTFYKWEIDSGDVIKEETLEYSRDWQNPKAVCELKYDKNAGNGKGCTLKKIKCDDGNQFNNITLIVDTGDDPNNVYTIRVTPNIDQDGDEINETFSWFPYEITSPWDWNKVTMNVLLKGKGSLVIDVPDGVVYQDYNKVKVMHYSWFMLTGGKYEQKTINGTTIDYYDSTNVAKDATFVAGFIHDNCTEGDGCSYSELRSTNKCSICGTEKTIVKCTLHDEVKEYCNQCTPETDHTGSCSLRLDKKAVDDYLQSHPDIKSQISDDEGNVIYPTANIFLVSCDESADFRFCSYLDGTGFQENSFFGYVYAPYMTFKAYGGESAGVRILGGMTVSDYILDASNSYVGCWPTKMPTDLMSDSCKKDQLPPLKDKSWKLQLVG